MRVWADVYVPDGTLRADFERSALFYIPKYYDAAHSNGISLNYLYALATSIKKNPEIDIKVPGRLAINRVYDCAEPVAYNNAVRAINLLNEALKTQSISFSLDTSDIIACIFWLRLGPEIKDLLGRSMTDELSSTGLSEVLLDSALNRGRVSYHDAHAIWAALYARRKKNSKFLPGITAITPDETDLIAADKKDYAPLRVPKTDRHDREIGINELVHVYRRENLHPAPRSGHEWAVDDGESSPAKAKQ